MSRLYTLTHRVLQAYFIHGVQDNVTLSYLCTRDFGKERILLDPLYTHTRDYHFVSILFRAFLWREKQAALCVLRFIPRTKERTSSILSVIKNINSYIHSNRKFSFSFFPLIGTLSLGTFIRNILAKKNDAARLHSPPHTASESLND